MPSRQPPGWRRYTICERNLAISSFTQNSAPELLSACGRSRQWLSNKAANSPGDKPPIPCSSNTLITSSATSANNSASPVSEARTRRPIVFCRSGDIRHARINLRRSASFSALEASARARCLATSRSSRSRSAARNSASVGANSGRKVSGCNCLYRSVSEDGRLCLFVYRTSRNAAAIHAKTANTRSIFVGLHTAGLNLSPSASPRIYIVRWELFQGSKIRSWMVENFISAGMGVRLSTRGTASLRVSPPTSVRDYAIGRLKAGLTELVPHPPRTGHWRYPASCC